MEGCPIVKKGLHPTYQPSLESRLIRDREFRLRMSATLRACEALRADGIEPIAAKKELAKLLIDAGCLTEEMKRAPFLRERDA